MPDENSITFAGVTLTYQAKDDSVVAHYGFFSETVPGTQIDKLQAWINDRRNRTLNFPAKGENANQSDGT